VGQDRHDVGILKVAPRWRADRRELGEVAPRAPKMKEYKVV